VGQVVRLSAVREARMGVAAPLSKADVARRYGVSVRTVSRWMQRGCPYRKPYAGGSVRFRAAEVDAWLRRRA
jgi:excisionase family DNA binding protein